ncbi:MAG TPA: Xaa-Pro peptidase family protein [Candidatus Saccharimonadales bacterium]|nr:Xaa-Pro peptidase family protein [Candidatus Saccharimonadales bacterium]
MQRSTNRLKLLREKLEIKKLDAVLVSSTINRHYLTGWAADSESGYLLITQKKAFLITDSRYTEEALEKVPHFQMREIGRDENFWEKLFTEVEGSRIGFEGEDLSVAQFKNFKKHSSAKKLVSTTNLIEKLRAKKDSNEIRLLQKAAFISDQAFKHILKNIKVGQTEKEIAVELEKFMKDLGAEKNAWDPFIVASGPNSSKVHYSAGERKLKKGDQILLDWGGVYQGYCSDISRVVFLGSPSKKQAEVYNLVLEAQKKGIEQVKVGNANKNVDLAARTFLNENSKFAFGHSVGHGVGLAVHELPMVNFRTKEKLEEGNVITVEPGIYEPLWGGVRIEDMVLVTKEGPVVLTKAPKEIKQVIV